MTKSIPLTKGKFALVSDNRFDVLSLHKWRACFNGWNLYAVTTIKGKNVYLHRFIMEVTEKSVLVDHIDGNGLNCQDENLRLSTVSQNGMNRGKQKDNASGYKGVCWDTGKKKWMASIKIDQKNIFLGRFERAEDAAVAYDVAAKKYHKDFARTNFGQ